MRALHAIGRRRTLPAGQVLSWAGDPNGVCATLVGGVLKVSRQDADARVQTVGLLFPGDFVGELFVDTAGETVTALAEADLCLYSRRPLERVLAEHPVAERLMLRRALATLAEARRWMLMLGRRHANERVAAFLLDMSRRVGGSPAPDCFALPMSRAAIGEVLGLTIETVSRQMTALRTTG